ncbi:ScpA/B protein [Clostridiales bacterium KA00134]|nr:ScpA/B protein [Clostridiales bacterium KA00134]
MDYSVNLPVYEGPMDLLLDLIKENEIDIYDIPIAQISDEFLNYIERAKTINMDLTADFIIMASKLLEIKSKMMLPKKEKEVISEDEEDPRDELVQKILEYQKFKEIGSFFENRALIENRSIIKEPMDFDDLPELEFFIDFEIDKLSKTFNLLLKKAKIREATEKVVIESDKFSISDAMKDLSLKLKENNNMSFYKWIGSDYSVEKLVTYFLAVLELIKNGEILVRQGNLFEDIEIRSRLG